MRKRVRLLKRPAAGDFRSLLLQLRRNPIICYHPTVVNSLWSEQL